MESMRNGQKLLINGGHFPAIKNIYIRNRSNTAYLDRLQGRKSMAYSALYRHRKAGFAVSFCIVMVGLVLLSVTITSDNVAAGTGPKGVVGIVRDSVGRLLEGAVVTVNMFNGAGPAIRDTQTDTTDIDGQYSVSFDLNDWFVGDTIQVIAICEGAEEENSTTADDSPFQQVDVTYAFEIPEFGSLAGILISAGILGIIASVALRKRK